VNQSIKSIKSPPCRLCSTCNMLVAQYKISADIKSTLTFQRNNVGGVVVDHLLFLFSVRGSVPEIFAIEVDSCLKSRRILDVFCPPKF